ncbi:glycoside hydrolase family 55 protein [Acidicapsa acidisoli]|uniref:glycoside hydrolase family 55 protein n=1 Tax=Acidicapsa acidisoli TaxID=1615681 RepID=UPI0021E01973|nr:glycoside hydrolase family 55 protein [Acidicapsa acidisoli]
MKRILISIAAILLHGALFACCSRAQTTPLPVADRENWAANPTVSPESSQGPNLGSTVINVLNYGAKGDRVTDDTASIDSAMTACVTRPRPNNGCVLYFPAGVYITTGVSLKSFVNLKGDGWGTTVIQLKPHTDADVLTVPADVFNFSIYGLTLDGNSARGGTGNCFSTATTPTGPGEWNTANKRTATINAMKLGHIEEVMFSNCSRDGIHINAYNYMLTFDHFYVFNNGVYGVYTQGTNSGFSNFQIERNGTAGIHIANANNRFTSGEVIWNGASVNTEAAVYVSGGRNILTAVEAEDNYTNGFFDSGIDDEFSGCVSDSNGYVSKNPGASSRSASGFILAGTGGVYVGDKVTSYRGRLPDGNFTTEWPYRIDTSNQARVDISYDSTNEPPHGSASSVPQVGSPAAGHAACIKSAGPPVVIGFCSTAVSPSGACSCN